LLIANHRLNWDKYCPYGLAKLPFSAVKLYTNKNHARNRTLIR
jgi:hypothetical protein